MINEIVTGLIAIIIGYLLGSFPSAYVITRLTTGKDIRQLGSGNVGTNNTYREVGWKAAIAVAALDLGKGAAAVITAHGLLRVPLYEPQLFVLLTGVATVAGHIWSIYLKFDGGNGLAPTVGVLALLMPWEWLIAIALILLLGAIIRNMVLSTSIGLLSVPISAWFLEKEWLYVGFCIVLILMMVVNFLFMTKATLVKAEIRGKLSAALLQREKR